MDVNAETPIDRLTALLRAHPGKCPVYLNVETSDGMTAQIECNPSIRASCGPEFLREAVELFLETASPQEAADRLHAEVYVTPLEVDVG